MTTKAIPLEQILSSRAEITKTIRLFAVAKGAKDTSHGFSVHNKIQLYGFEDKQLVI